MLRLHIGHHQAPEPRLRSRLAFQEELYECCGRLLLFLVQDGVDLLDHRLSVFVDLVLSPCFLFRDQELLKKWQIFLLENGVL